MSYVAFMILGCAGDSHEAFWNFAIFRSVRFSSISFFYLIRLVGAFFLADFGFFSFFSIFDPVYDVLLFLINLYFRFHGNMN